MVYFPLSTLVNGISTFVGYLIPMAFLKNSSGTKEVLTFPKGYNLIVNVMARLGFELAYNNVTVKHVNHYTTGTHHRRWITVIKWNFGRVMLWFIILWLCLVWFLCLIVYQTLWVIQCQGHPCWRSEVLLFKVSLFNSISTFVGYSMPRPSLLKISSVTI